MIYVSGMFRSDVGWVISELSEALHSFQILEQQIIQRHSVTALEIWILDN